MELTKFNALQTGIDNLEWEENNYKKNAEQIVNVGRQIASDSANVRFGSKFKKA